MQEPCKHATVGLTDFGKVEFCVDCHAFRAKGTEAWTEVTHRIIHTVALSEEPYEETDDESKTESQR